MGFQIFFYHRSLRYTNICSFVFLHHSPFVNYAGTFSHLRLSYHILTTLRQKSEKPPVFRTRERVHIQESRPPDAGIRRQLYLSAHFCLRVHYTITLHLLLSISIVLLHDFMIALFFYCMIVLYHYFFIALYFYFFVFLFVKAYRIVYNKTSNIFLA